jgi:uncharacterized caspase-like protein
MYEEEPGFDYLPVADYGWSPWGPQSPRDRQCRIWRQPFAQPRQRRQSDRHHLRELEFEVQLVTDADLQQMESALNRFITALSPNDEALFYYSGHGANYNGDNYLIPLGWSFTDETELRYKAFNSNLALERLQKARISIMILDACRDNPYRGARSGPKPGHHARQIR